MDLNLKNKVFIISGGSEGIGEAISRTIAEEGGIPVFATRSLESSEKLFEELKSQNKKSHYITGELENSQTCQRVIQETINLFGQIDGIVNNAGANDNLDLETSPEKFHKSLTSNLLHYYNLVHFALPYLKESKGAIVNISSKVALTGQGNTSAYAAAKGAQLALTREWAVALLPYSIRVNAILPAEVMTPLYRNWLDKNFDNAAAKETSIVNKIPLEKRMTTTEEIAATTAFLLSDKSSHTTGQWIIVDGGYVHLDRSIT